MSPTIIQTSQLFKSYSTAGQASPVLCGIDMSVQQGECLFLAGPSGSGKTTLLSILGCVLSADSGVVRVLEHDVTHLNAEEQATFRREQIGFVFQRFHLFDSLTAVENVCIPLSLLRWKTSIAVERANYLLDLLGLGSLARRNVTQLSMGQRQRVAVARALAADPRLILADEPTASLDEEAGLQAMTVLKDLCRRLNKTVVIVTHDARIFPFADRVLFLNKGRMQSGNPPAAHGVAVASAVMSSKEAA